MKVYLSMVKVKVSKKFLARFVQISRKKNEQADCLAKAVSAEHMSSTVWYYPSFNTHLPLTRQMYR